MSLPGGVGSAGQGPALGVSNGVDVRGLRISPFFRYRRVCWLTKENLFYSSSKFKSGKSRSSRVLCQDTQPRVLSTYKSVGDLML